MAARRKSTAAADEQSGPAAEDALGDATSGDGAASLRLDKWLWHARFFRTRSLAAGLCEAGRLRLNRAIVRKAHQPVRPGDVLTFPQGSAIRVVRVRALGLRREGAVAARHLYDDLDAAESRV